LPNRRSSPLFRPRLLPSCHRSRLCQVILNPSTPKPHQRFVSRRRHRVSPLKDFSTNKRCQSSASKNWGLGFGLLVSDVCAHTMGRKFGEPWVHDIFGAPLSLIVDMCRWTRSYVQREMASRQHLASCVCTAQLGWHGLDSIVAQLTSARRSLEECFLAYTYGLAELALRLSLPSQFRSYLVKENFWFWLL
jgi:hypothetical protein